MNNDKQVLNALLSKYDKENKVVEETDISIEFHAFSRNKDGQIESSEMAEIIAFTLVEKYTDENTGWGTYYGPFVVIPDSNGKMFENPSIDKIDEKIISYWKERAINAKNSVFRARYADLIWDFTKKVTDSSPDVQYAKIAIDSIINIAENNLLNDIHITFIKLERSLSIAISINDKNRIKKITETTIFFEKENAQDHFLGTWGYSYDLLMNNKKVSLTKTNEETIILELESRLARAADINATESFDPFACEKASEMLASYYRNKRQNADVRRVLLIYRDVFIEASKKVPASTSSAWFQKIYEVFLNYNLQSEAGGLSSLLAKLFKESTGEMVSIPFEITMTQDKRDIFETYFSSGSLDEITQKLSEIFVLSRENILKQIKKGAKKNQLYTFFTQKLCDDDGRVVGTVGPLSEDEDGRIILSMSQNMQITKIHLRLAFEILESKKIIDTEKILSQLYKSPLFHENQKEIFAQGVGAYFDKNWIASAHILIPQIESALRKLISLSGGQIYKLGKHNGLSLRTLGDILSDANTKEILGEDITLYLKVLMNDPRGWNLRNNICHGFKTSEKFNEAVCDRIIHVLLLLSTVRPEDK